MRTSILIFALLGTLAFGTVDAKSRSEARPAQVQQCDVVKGGTKGLYGLCVSFCAQQGNSPVNLNDIASIKASSSDVRILRRYNRRMRDGDPKMPCLPHSDDDDDDGDNDDDDDDNDGDDDDDDDNDGDDDGDDDGDTDQPPPLEPTLCPCWSGLDGAARLASIDGVTTVEPSYVSCSTHVNALGVIFGYEVREGEGADAGSGGATVGVASALTDLGTLPGTFFGFNGCFVDTAEGTGNITLDRATAQQCMTEIENQCATLGNP